MRAQLQPATLTALYEYFLNHKDCGPLDGGCLVVAKALAKLMKGKVFVLVGRKNGSYGPQHAVCKARGLFWDSEGGWAEKDLIARWYRLERVGWGMLRAIRPGEISEVDFPDLVQGVVEILRRDPLFAPRANPNLSQLGYLPPEGLEGFWLDFQEGTKEYRDWARGGDGNREDGKVWLDLENDFDRPFVWIQNIGSNDRRKGLAGKALTWICQLADRHGIELRLVASPVIAAVAGRTQKDTLTLRELKRWYKRHGFKPIPGRGGDYMRRRPR